MILEVEWGLENLLLFAYCIFSLSAGGAKHGGIIQRGGGGEIAVGVSVLCDSCLRTC